MQGELRVALDMRPASEPGTGIGRYARNLAQALALVDEVDVHLLYKTHNQDPQIFGTSVKYAPEKNWLQAFVPRYCKDHAVQIFHGTNFVVPLMAPIYRVVTVHDMTLFNIRSGHRLRTLLVHGVQSLLSLAVADAVITDSRATANALGDRFPWLRTRLHHVPLGVNSNFVPLKGSVTSFKVEGTNIAKPFVLNVGKQEPRKNLPLLIEGFARACQWPQWVHDLVLVGPDGSASRDVRQAVRDSGVESRIHLLGVVGDAELLRLYQRASLVVYPSSLEGFGLPVLEAMACGVPVVTLSDPSVLEVTGSAAMVLPSATPEALANALQSGVRIGRARAERIRQGLIRAAAYRWEYVANATVNIYREVVHSRPRRGLIH
jgi:glycosyltransferase involved in cell wall biosynthesis